MNILIVTPIFPPQIGGPATYVWELVKRLKKKHNITIVYFGSKRKKIAKATLILISTTKNTLSRQSRLFASVFSHSKHADVVYIQGALIVGLTAMLAAKLRCKKTLLKFVGDEVWETAVNHHKTTLSLEKFYRHPLPVTYQLHNLLQRITLLLSSKIIVPSLFLKQFLTSIHKINPQKIKVIPNAVNTKSINTIKQKHQLIFVGRLVPWKNINQVIKAVNIARKINPWKLIIVGSGPEEKNLKQLVQKYNASNWVKFTGKLSRTKTHHHIAQSQKLILYSSYEGMPHVLIEAMLLNTPIIASNIKPNKQTTNNYAHFVPQNNIKALAQAINSSQTSKKAQKFAQSTYTWHKHIKSLETLLK